VSNEIVDKLRRAIDAKHDEAIHALQTVAAYLEEPVVVEAHRGERADQKRSRSRQKSKRPPRQGTGKIRPAVLAACSQGFLPVKTVAEQTGFTTLQVRGVIMSPSLKDKFSKQEIDGVMHYKYEGNNRE